MSRAYAHSICTEPAYIGVVQLQVLFPQPVQVQNHLSFAHGVGVVLICGRPIIPPPFPPTPGGPLRPRSPPRCTARRLIQIRCRSGSLLKSRFSSQKALRYLPQRSRFYFRGFSIFPVRVFIFSKFGTIPFFVHFSFVLEIRCISQPCANGLRQQGLPDDNEDGPHGGGTQISPLPPLLPQPFRPILRQFAEFSPFGIELFFAYVAMYTDLI